jgi:hypothetical protein
MITVSAPAVASISVALNPSTIVVGQSSQATATVRDAQNNILGSGVSWTSTDNSVATVASSGAISALKAGVTTIIGSTSGKSGSALLTVNAPQATCSSNQLSALTVGEIRTLSSAQKSFFCLAGGAAGSEYVLIPFFNVPVAASTINLRLSGQNTLAPAAIRTSSASTLLRESSSGKDVGDMAFRIRERRDLQGKLSASRPSARFSRELTPSRITGIPSTPAVGAVFNMNANISGNTCSDPKELHGARVVAVLPHVIVMIDTSAPTGGYTNAEMTAFGQAFENLGYPLDTLNFGSPTDIDGNGRVLIFFTTGVNRIPGPPGAIVGGLQASRDLFPVSTCPASNEGEMFYMPVPDPNKTINENYSNKSVLGNGVQAVLVHELQHLINASRRAYVNNASVLEESWLNEGLSHIAEELLYYQSALRSPRTNISLSSVQSSQAQVDAFNTYQFQNFSRLITYLKAPETNSPFAQNDNLETRGAIWQLLRYAADRRGGSERTTWYSLVNATAAGQQNFNNVLGNIITLTRDWAVAQYADDNGFSVSSNYTNPSWQFRGLTAALNNGNFPLLTRSLTGSPIDLTLVGGSASYVRFQVAGNSTGTLTLTASGQPVPSEVDVIVMRTK